MSSKSPGGSGRKTAATAMGAARGRKVVVLIMWLVFVLASVGMLIVLASSERGFAETIRFQFSALGFLLVGSLIVSRRRGNTIGWIFCSIAILWTSGSFATEYASYSYTERPLPGGLLAAWYQEWYWLPWLFLLLGASTLLFPDGKLPSPRWRPVGWVVCGSAVALTILASLDPTLNPEGFARGVSNPIGLSPLGDPDGKLAVIFLPAFYGGAIACAVSLVVRFRSASGDQKQQMKWFVYGATIFVMLFLGLAVLDATGVGRSPVADAIFMCLPPATAGIAILRHRLYDIDVVISKTIVFGALAVFITAVYVTIVVGIGTFLGSQDEPNLALSIAATAIVAIGFSPVKDRVQKVANRLVYGHRLPPYEVLSNLARTVAGAGSPQEVLTGIAQGAAIGINADTRVTLDLGSGRTMSQTWPPGSEHRDSYDVTLSITRRGESLGGLAVRKPRNEPVTPKDKDLLEDLRAQAGLGLFNARLVIELQARLEQIEAQAHDLRVSRERIVGAQDDSRKALERDISLGPQRVLEQIYQDLNRAVGQIDSDPEGAAGTLQDVTAQTTSTLESLREIARGIYPPLLADKGLVAALEAHARKNDLPITIDADEATTEHRFGDALEPAAYFCCVEVLSDRPDVPRTVSISQTTEELRLEITNVRAQIDNERRIADRVEALGGVVKERASVLEISIPLDAGESGQPVAAAHASSS
ncbi:MAG: hypothetical protein M3280_13645 [Actinomycetota bacterium]|nr:hypothetical protein [Actinomycetota bacterium]